MNLLACCLHLALLCGISGAFRNVASSDESRAASIPKQYVVDNLLDISKIFRGKTRVQLAGTSAIYKCCKSRPDQLGVLIDEASPKANELCQGCRGLLGIRFRSFTKYEPERREKRARCVVARSGMPQAFLRYKFPAEVAPVVGELVDVTDVLMKRQTAITLPSGRTYRCCMKEGDQHAFLVEHRENVLDGTLFQGLQDKIAAVSGKKCSGLLGIGYSSWQKWQGNRCLVLSSSIPKEAMKVLGWTLQPTIPLKSQLPVVEPPKASEEATSTTSKPGRQLVYQDSTLSDEIEEVDASIASIEEEVAQDTTPASEEEDSNLPTLPTEEDASSSQEVPVLTGTGTSSWKLSLRVVDATSGKTLKAVPVKILSSKQQQIAEGKTSKVGMATFEVPEDADVLFLSISKKGYMPIKRRYIRSRQCGGANDCMTQCAVSPKF